jgi:phosphotransferase system, enzyme I, PtsP
MIDEENYNPENTLKAENLNPASLRVLLRRLREVMAEEINTQARLDKIVVTIAASMDADVCSCYVMRADNALELYATQGLNKDSVHLTTMSVDEGLVGLIAREAEPLSLSKAQEHPAFSYKPETGEEIYNGFLGVPILRSGNTVGVLVLQNKSFRIYIEEEIEALQTTAMILAEMIASGELQALAQAGIDLAARRSMQIAGTQLSEGIGLGYAVLHQPRVEIKNFIAEDIPAEIIRLEDAVLSVRSSVDEMLERGDVTHQGEHREILETVRMFAYNQGWMKRLLEGVNSGLSAEASVERWQSDARAKLMRSTDPYLRERLFDIDDLAYRVLHALSGKTTADLHKNMPDDAIIVARSMGPAALLDYDRSRVRGLILEEGGPTSHIAIVARALGVPVVSEVENVTSLVEERDALIVDGIAGDIHIRPMADIQLAYVQKAKLRAKKQEQYRALKDVTPLTQDGELIDLHINAGLLIDVPHLDEIGAQGIGLFRTELQFMVAARLPTSLEQQALYAQVIEQAKDRPVTFRTLDIGGDKKLPYMEVIEEENPALGWRALRIGLDRPGLLRAQLRALIRAAEGKPLKIMFPMVGALREFEEAKAIVGRELAHIARYRHQPPSEIKLGVMVEIPSLIHQIHEIAAKVDFISVGSNDLMQYMFAVDRENRRVANRFDSLSAPFLRALKIIVDAAREHDCPISLCGEMGGKPLEAMALLGLGPVKAMLLKTDAGAVAALLEHLMKREGASASIRPALADFALRHGIPI